jgi:hypothetical protein
MPLGQVFIFERGRKPVITERWHITEDPEWQALQTRKNSN